MRLISDADLLCLHVELAQCVSIIVFLLSASVFALRLMCVYVESDQCGHLVWSRLCHCGSLECFPSV